MRIFNIVDNGEKECGFNPNVVLVLCSSTEKLKSVFYQYINAGCTCQLDIDSIDFSEYCGVVVVKHMKYNYTVISPVTSDYAIELLINDNK